MARARNTDAVRRVHGAILGYQPFRMKPVHFATSFLLALTGRYYRLEYLNKASVPKTAPKDGKNFRDEYPSDRLHSLLVERGTLDRAVDLEAFRTLQAHLNAAYNNDGAALSAVFRPYTTFGADYSAPSIRYISNRSKNHGYSGSFVLAVLKATAEGRETLERIRSLLDLSPPPLATFGEPLLDDTAEDWSDRHDELYGEIDPERLIRVGSEMEDCTVAVGRLAANLERLQSNYSMRFIVLGLCCWLFTYLMRQGSDSSLLLVDALQGSNPRIRAQSRASYARALDLFSSSYDRTFADGNGADIAESDWKAFAESADARQILDDHFRDLGVRIGVVQPRSPVAKHKHIDLQADTLRVLAYSLLEKDRVMRLPEFAAQLRATWSIVVGARAGDGDDLRANRFGPLDQDEDLLPNAMAFQALLVRLGLAVEPSDGLTLVAIDAEELI